MRIFFTLWVSLVLLGGCAIQRPRFSQPYVVVFKTPKWRFADTGYIRTDDRLAERITAASEATHERVWRLPLWDEYREQLKSNFADLANIGGRNGGAVTAACFLSRFAERYRWAHLDIAGTAWRSGAEKGATGRPVAMLGQFLLDHARGSRQRKKKSS